MSTSHPNTFSSGSGLEQDRRAQRLASARKKLQMFRASQSSLEHTHSSTSSTLSKLSSRPPSPAKSMPLTTEVSINAPSPFSSHERSSSQGKAKEMCAEPPSPTRLSGMVGPAVTGEHRHKRSDSQAHRRQRSSVAIPAGTPMVQGLLVASPVGTFGTAQPSGIITTPPTPMTQAGLVLVDIEQGDEGEGGDGDNEEDSEQVAARLSAFKFGAKPVRAATFPPKRRQASISSAQGLFADSGVPPSTSPLGSPTSLGRFSTPSSRPPSLLVTRPTPKMLDSPTPAGPSLHSTPSSPPTPVRKKRHSHTRSNSISLPNLKLGNANSRPTSLGVPTSPGLSSPASPPSTNGDIASRSRLSGPVNGQRLKFEPSGRGAEAEKEREESRRRALEKLTGGAPRSRSRSPMVESPLAEISLPDLDDEDSSSVASSNRPLSGAFSLGSSSSFFFTGGHSSFTVPPLSASSTSTPPTLSASPFPWASPTAEDRSPSERWSGSSFGLQKEYAKDDGMGGFGLELGAATAKRPSINRQLSALTEVDESEEDEVELDDVPEDDDEGLEEEMEGGMAHDMSPDPEPSVPEALVSPTNGLRELRLPSSISMPRGDTPSSAGSVRTFTFPRGAHASSPVLQGPSSPKKSFGIMGRDRAHMAPEAGAGATVTPKNGSARRRAALGSGSRGSSISYKKDDGSTSSRDMSVATRGVGLAGMGSPPLVMSPTAGMGMGGMMASPTKIGRWVTASANARGGARPCPRPKVLAGASGGVVGEGGASGTALGEVDQEEDGTPHRRWGQGFGKGEAPMCPFEASPAAAATAHTHSHVSAQTPASASARRYSTFSSEGGGRPSSEMSRDSFGERMQWRDVQLEMEREREGLRDEVDVWKRRCKVLEERLDAERKEGAVLRERVRKLGDRLSSVSSLPTERRTAESQAHAASSRLIAEMRDQLFNLTTSLEHERRVKDHALTELANVQHQINTGGRKGSLGLTDDSEEEELLMTARPDEGSFPAVSPFFASSVGSSATTPALESGPEPIEHPAPERSHKAEEPVRESPDLNSVRIKGWGFPKNAPTPTPREKKRESFFGLSKVLRRSTSAEDDASSSTEGLGMGLPAGVDLPPFTFDESAHAHAGVVVAQRAVSDPTLSFSATGAQSVYGHAAHHTHPEGNSSSASAPGMFSFGGYTAKQSPESDARRHEREREPRKMSKRREYAPMPESMRTEMPLPGLAMAGGARAGAGMDFRNGCRCCVGQVIEV